MSLGEKKKRRTPAASSVAEQVIAGQVPPDRRKEILEYLKLFGYKPERTVLQVHIAGFFNRRRYDKREQERRQAAAKRYGGTTFVIVGRTHDPAIMEQVVKPRKKGDAASPGYIGYLWKKKDPQDRAPHEVLPLDFTPVHVPYPDDWKNMFATRGFMMALHVPSSFAKDKNRLSRALYRAGKNADVRKRWDFVDQVRGVGFGQHETKGEDPLNILNVRLAKGEISQSEYESLRKSMAT
ncbi:MAG TPA: SHOCT domain-containing protein [Nitrososphaera sp.]|jgi:hypothetical protein